jgi:hypothetical protein
MDAIGNALGIDPIEVRRRNLIGKEEMPYPRQLGALETGVILDSGDCAGLLDKRSMPSLGTRCANRSRNGVRPVKRLAWAPVCLSSKGEHNDE